MIGKLPTLAWRRAAAELILLIGLGVLMWVIGPYGTGALPPWPRALYWLGSIVGGGAIGVAVEESLGRRLSPSWRRVVLTSAVMTPGVALLVVGVNLLLVPRGLRPTWSPVFLWQVFVICALVMTLRALSLRPPRTVVETRTVIETRTVVAPPLPEAEAAFRRRLSSKRRTARLIAVQAEDHYLRVHTDAGEELLTMRFTDALQELSAAHGFQVHRSWWIAADAIEGVRWRKGVGDARLMGGQVAPVSRTHAPRLKEAGWF